MRRSRPNRSVFDARREKEFEEAFQNWRTVGPVSTSRVMATDRPYGELEWEVGKIVGGEEWQEKVYSRVECK
jgi:hypothetical protein